MERLREELVFEEQEAKRRQADQAEAEKKQRMKEELLKGEEDWKRAKAERLRKEAEEEEKFKQQILAKFAEDDRIEQMSQQKRRMKVAEHMREAEKLMAERRAAKEREAEEERRQWEEEKARQDERRRLIQEERLRILKEHAVKLWGYLPKGVIQNEEELAVFPEEIQREYLATKVMGQRDNVFDNKKDQELYNTLYERDLKQVVGSSDIHPYGSSSSSSSSPPTDSTARSTSTQNSSLLPGLGGQGTGTRVHPKYRNTRPW